MGGMYPSGKIQLHPRLAFGPTGRGPRASERGEGLLTTIDFRLAGDASGNIPYKGGMDVRKAD